MSIEHKSYNTNRLLLFCKINSFTINCGPYNIIISGVIVTGVLLTAQHFIKKYLINMFMFCIFKIQAFIVNLMCNRKIFFFKEKSCPM